MNCYLHPDTPATAFCRSCGRPLCALCQRTAEGTIYCMDHAPVTASGPAYGSMPEANPAAGPNPYFQAVPPVGRPHVANSPGLAFMLGWIPGVGAIYNGQYLKGLIHAVIFGMLMSITNGAENTSGQPLLIMTMAAFVFYMPFEAYHTAKKRQLGVPIEEWSSLVGQSGMANRAPVGPILLIAIGVLFLLDTLNLIQFREIGRFWPVLLIAAGAYMLWARVTARPFAPGEQPYVAPGADRPVNPVMGGRHE